MLDHKGYAKVCDFGFAKRITNDLTFTLCGTPEYLAPEVVKGKGHGLGVDWWTVGILTFELLDGFPPFYSKSQLTLYRRIVHDNIKFPDRFSDTSKLFIVGLTQKKSTQRLGVVNGGVKRIKRHRWFLNFDWDALKHRSMKAPNVPKIKNATDTRNFDEYKDPSNNRLSMFLTNDFSKFCR